LPTSPLRCFPTGTTSTRPTGWNRHTLPDPFAPSGTVESRWRP